MDFQNRRQALFANDGGNVMNHSRIHSNRNRRLGLGRFGVMFGAAVLILLFYSAPSLSQSTFGSIVGTVKDASGDVVTAAGVVLMNTGTSAKRSASTDSSGYFSFVNVEPGTYQLVVEQPGFQRTEFVNLDLQARETKRVDAALKIATQSQTVVVEETAGAVVTTDVSNLTETKTGKELIDLPVAIYSRSAGSTSPISTLTTQPGVQTDDTGNLTIAGATPALLSYTIDGISSVNVESSGPINELFPSFNSIAEIKVSETNNNAEFSGVSDVTTVSRSGTNSFHGGIFENHENAALNAGNPFASEKPKLIMNDFGGYFGGPVSLPKLYSGRDRTFLFMSYEGLRLPRQTPLLESFPSTDMRNGNLCAYLNGTQIYQPNGTPVPCDAVPVSPLAANVMKYLFPLPNTGAPGAFSNNYQVNFPAPISSNQADLRIDQKITSKQSIYARVTYKNRQVQSAPVGNCPGFCATSGSPSLGAFSQPEQDAGLTIAYNYVIKPTLINELRAGFNGLHAETTFGLSTTGILDQLGLEIPSDVTLNTIATVPNFQVTGFQMTGGANPSVQRSNIFQILDNLTWTKRNHTFKFGGDFRRMTDHDDNVFGNTRSGQFTFDGSATSLDVNGNDPAVSGLPPAVGDPFAAFLMGYPDYSVLSQVNNPAMNGLGYSYAVFGQDDWKVTSSLTLNFGLRYEIHPPLKDTSYNTADFLPNWSGTVNGQAVNGAVVVPNAKGLSWTIPAFAESIAPTPILTAAQAGVPDRLRYTDKSDFGPRIGFAWRPFHNDKTVIRGGYGRFIESPLGFSLVSGWAVHASSVPYYYQAFDPAGNAALTYPSPFPSNLNVTGSQTFYYAFPVHYHDPSVQQWNLTFERDLGFGTGLRLSYTGSHGSNLETMEDLNQVPANTDGYAVAGNSRPFPIWSVLQSVYNAAESNYNNLTVDLKKRFSGGLQFESSYAFTRDLSDEGGGNPSNFVPAGGNWLSDRFHPGLDYGNVIYDRRHRFLTTYLYELPVGKGKRFLSGSNALVDGVLGGWELGGVVVIQSGPFLTPYDTSSDPAGTNQVNTAYFSRPDIVSGVSPYAHGLTSPNGPLFLNPAAYTIPGTAIGRFGNSAVGSVVGPGTRAVSMSLIKTVKFTEAVRLQFGAEVANLLNHRNYEPPNMAVDTGGFGTITGLQTAEGAGPRSVQLTARISF
jgi:hypothetical protein